MVTRDRATRRMLGAAAGLLVDRAFGEPPAALHPVAFFGNLMEHVERRLHRDARAPGVAYAGAGLAIGVTTGAVLGSTAAAVAGASAGRMLRTRAREIQHTLEAGAIDDARAELPSLVGRDPSELDESGIAAAVIESVAENTVDAVVAPALWGAALGAPGAAGYRAVNTMDAMVGHHSQRYEQFGWCSARVDDVAAFVPARVTAALVCAVRPSRATAVRSAIRTDAPEHPSPNAGVAEAAFAAALDLELGGTLRYAGRVEHRPRLGGGARPAPADIERAAQLADRVELALVALLAVLGFVISRRARKRSS
jgi:adenosylcobinamide-phosphate synthase